MLELLTGPPRLNDLLKKRKALVILATPRSGSSLLCSDLESIGVYGSPIEAMLPIIRSGALTRKNAKEFSKATQSENSSYFSIKLMHSHLPSIGAWAAYGDPISRAGHLSDQDLIDEAFRFFRDNFEQVSFVHLEREDLFAQAYSVWRAQETGVWHHKNSTMSQAPTPAREPELQEIFDAIAKVTRWKSQLAEATQTLNNVSHVRYQDLQEFPCYIRRILDASGEPSLLAEQANRTFHKVTPDGEMSRARDNAVSALMRPVS